MQKTFFVKPNMDTRDSKTQTNNAAPVLLNYNTKIIGIGIVSKCWDCSTV